MMKSGEEERGPHSNHCLGFAPVPGADPSFPHADPTSGQGFMALIHPTQRAKLTESRG